jgi:hypothetical protein
MRERSFGSFQRIFTAIKIFRAAGDTDTYAIADMIGHSSASGVS